MSHDSMVMARIADPGQVCRAGEAVGVGRATAPYLAIGLTSVSTSDLLSSAPGYHRRRSMWLEIEVEAGGQEVRVSARGSRGERPAAHTLSPELGPDALQSLAGKVGRAVRGGRALD